MLTLPMLTLPRTQQSFPANRGQDKLALPACSGKTSAHSRIASFLQFHAGMDFMQMFFKPQTQVTWQILLKSLYFYASQNHPSTCILTAPKLPC